MTRIAKRASSLPIVAIGLPAGAAAKDLYESLAKPGGTITGFSTYGGELSAKRIQIVRQVLPQAKVIGILHNVIDPVFREWGDQTEASAKAQGLMRCGSAFAPSRRASSRPCWTSYAASRAIR